MLVEGRRIAAITKERPAAECVLDRPGRFVLPGLLNLHNHCFSEAVARTHTEDGGGRKANSSIVYTVLLPLSRAAASRSCAARSGWRRPGSASCNCCWAASPP